MTLHEILPGESTCSKRIEDLDVEDQQEDCQDLIFRDEAFFIDKEEQRQDHRDENADDSEDSKKVQGHRKAINNPLNLYWIICGKKSNRSSHPIIL